MKKTIVLDHYKIGYRKGCTYTFEVNDKNKGVNMGNQRNIKRERLKKEHALRQLQEITISQVKTLAFLTGYQKFCKEKNLEFDSNEYVSKFVKSLKDENGNIDLQKLDDAINQLGGSVNV